MKRYKDFEVIAVRNRKGWRTWLQKNHETNASVWLIVFHKANKEKKIFYEEAVEEAICFGWVDSKANKKDNESYFLFFSRRKPTSNWSNANKIRAIKMIAMERMAPAGEVCIEIAKSNGCWDALTNVQKGVIPDDLQILFNKNKPAYDNFKAFPKSTKRNILEWILNAKKSQTRQNRLEQTIALAAKNIRAKQ